MCIYCPNNRRIISIRFGSSIFICEVTSSNPGQDTSYPGTVAVFLYLQANSTSNWAANVLFQNVITSLMHGLDSGSAVPQCGLCWSSRGSRKKLNPWELDHVANRLSHLSSHIQGLDSGCVIPRRTVAISWKFAWKPEKAEPLRSRPKDPQTVSRPPWSILRI